jgi:hypothetical protein
VNFPNSETNLDFADGTTINGEVVVTRIHLEPNVLPSDNPNTGNYWIINNYGTSSFGAIESLEFTVLDATPAGLPENAFLFVRSENEDANVWEERCNAVNFDGGSFNYTADCEITNFSQFYIESSVSDEVVVGVNEVTETNLIQLFPNPTNGTFIVNFENREQLILEIADNNGRLVFVTTLTDSGSLVDLSKFASGIYFYQFKDEQGIASTGKLVKL